MLAGLIENYLESYLTVARNIARVARKSTKDALKIINRRASRFGASRIKYELLNKGLGPEAVAEAVSRLKSSELERAQAIWRKKFDGPAPDAAARAKQMRFLAARGFGGDVIRRVVANAEDE